MVFLANFTRPLTLALLAEAVKPLAVSQSVKVSLSFSIQRYCLLLMKMPTSFKAGRTWVTCSVGTAVIELHTGKGVMEVKQASRVQGARRVQTRQGEKWKHHTIGMGVVQGMRLAFSPFTTSSLSLQLGAWLSVL